MRITNYTWPLITLAISCFSALLWPNTSELVLATLIAGGICSICGPEEASSDE